MGLGLAAVLGGLGAVRLPALVNGLRLSGAARTVATALRLARARALASSAAADVQFDLDRGALETVIGGVAVGGQALPAGVRFVAVPPRGRIRFDGLGAAENGTVTLAAGGRARSVVVNQRGRVRVP